MMQALVFEGPQRICLRELPVPQPAGGEVLDDLRTRLEAYRDSLFSELFPGRSEVPKTLIFCKDDHHAEEVVGIVRRCSVWATISRRRSPIRPTALIPSS